MVEFHSHKIILSPAVVQEIFFVVSKNYLSKFFNSYNIIKLNLWRAYDLVERIKGALFIIPFAVAFFLGNTIFSLLCIVLGAIAYFELFNAFKNKQKKASIVAATIFVIFLTLMVFIDIAMSYLVGILCFFFAVSIVFERLSVDDVSTSVLSLVYSFVPFCMLAELHGKNIDIAILVFIVSFSSDIFAYFSGKLFGKHKLIPKISPNKTVEGSIGAIIGTLIVTIVCCFFLDVELYKLILIGFFGSVIAQIGDLFASAIKRYCGIKDFSKLIPGHGGILDRFDSVMFVSLLICLFFGAC